MKSDKIRKFMELAGQTVSHSFVERDAHTRKLGAQLLLSECLEYVIHGLGVIPVVNGTPITEPNALEYQSSKNDPDKTHMLDGLADVAYTMYWNAEAFGIPLEEAFELICDNNLEKFVKLECWPGIREGTAQQLDPSQWHVGKNATWPDTVVCVEVVKINGEFYAVGKDARGKVQKPTHFKPVDLSPLINKAA